MGITVIVSTILIPIIKVMGISYPQGLGISICGYPLLKSFVEKLSKLFVDNSGFIMPYVHIVEKLSTSDVDNFLGVIIWLTHPFPFSLLVNLY